MIDERVIHHLSAAVRFVDHFTAVPVRTPLTVRADTLPTGTPGLPRVPWTACRAPADATYRFQVSNATTPPTGAIAITVEATAGDYAAFEPLTLTLPLVPPPHPLPVQPADFLVEHPLWPTPAARLPFGETAVVGTVRSAGANPIAGLRLKHWTGTGLPPAAPYAYTGAGGEFVFRLRELATNPALAATFATLSVEVRLPPAYAVAVPVGAVAGFTVPLTLRVGRVANVTFTIP